MAEYVIDLTGVEVRTGVTGNDRIAALWGVPLREKLVRCRDCEMCETYALVGSELHICKRFGDYWHTTDEDGFCAWGRRADG